MKRRSIIGISIIVLAVTAIFAVVANRTVSHAQVKRDWPMAHELTDHQIPSNNLQSSGKKMAAHATPVTSNSSSGFSPSTSKPTSAKLPFRPSTARLHGFKQENTPSFQPSFSPPSNRSQSRQRRASAAEDVMTLTRATYKLPAEAAEALTRLFEIESTSLVECKTNEIEDSELVQLVVTARPETQQAITRFVEQVFPKRIHDEQATNTIKLPTFAKPKISTDVSVPDGGTVVIGGIKPFRPGKRLVQLKVADLQCGAVVQRIRKFLNETKKVVDIRVDSVNNVLTFHLDDSVDVESFIDEAAEQNRIFKKCELISVR